MCNVGNLRISETSRSKLEKFQHSPAFPNIKHNCVVLFSVSIILVIYLCFKTYFPIKHHYKTLSESTHMLKTGRIYWTSYRVCDVLLISLRGPITPQQMMVILLIVLREKMALLLLRQLASESQMRETMALALTRCHSVRM